MWPTLSPKPTSAPEGMKHIRDMWKSLTAAEKQVRQLHLPELIGGSPIVALL